MKPSESQREIIQLFGGNMDNVLTTSDIRRAIGGKYYHGASRCVSERLTRLVRRGFLVRVSRGHYRLATFNSPSRRRAFSGNEDQLELF